MKKKFDLKIMAEISCFAACGWVLDYFQGIISDLIPFFPQGGSIGIAMIVVFIMAYKRGFVAGMLTGFIMGILDLMDGFYAISDSWYKIFLQILLDYVLSYTVVGVAGLFRSLIMKNKDNNKKALLYLSLGCLLGSFFKFMCHFLSGVIFFPSKIENKYLFSLTYNGLFMLPCFILTTIVLSIIFVKQKKYILDGEVL